ncbi:predicted protein [Plenodomus lingam JN3]|uniref:Predicted protein n=1 Tax=Leptosphaeria maculans (strain JN3 / isolate v23.1.3 / race Av1-4-5-6-7-8) TaxID=985895 RepID=E5ACM9_LEPMJ|nr:predicted protein [Plenodomus lingam JN3]CBY02231.1 predicted protein [Plenodomus lingam JN3]
MFICQRVRFVGWFLFVFADIKGDLVFKDSEYRYGNLHAFDTRQGFNVYDSPEHFRDGQTILGYAKIVRDNMGCCGPETDQSVVEERTRRQSEVRKSYGRKKVTRGCLLADRAFSL